MKTLSRMVVILAILVAGTAVGGYAQQNKPKENKKEQKEKKGEHKAEHKGGHKDKKH